MFALTVSVQGLSLLFFVLVLISFPASDFSFAALGFPLPDRSLLFLGLYPIPDSDRCPSSPLLEGPHDLCAFPLLQKWAGSSKGTREPLVHPEIRPAGGLTGDVEKIFVK